MLKRKEIAEMLARKNSTLSVADEAQHGISSFARTSDFHAVPNVEEVQVSIGPDGSVITDRRYLDLGIYS